MSGPRHYPPAVRVHGLTCPDIPAHIILSRLPVAEIVQRYPNAEPHMLCLSGGDRVGRIEVVEYPPHAYEQSSQFPKDAVRALCAYCKSTHGALDNLILPPGVALGVPGQKDSSPR
jgi:hypothetical protein